MLKEPINTGHYKNALSPEGCPGRRRCGCIKASERLKNILQTFPAVPAPPPSTPVNERRAVVVNDNPYHKSYSAQINSRRNSLAEKQTYSILWHVISELVYLVQLSVTATALTIYYLIYCYMELIYYTLRSAVYFHNADIPMKITIAIVTATTIIVAFNLLLRIEKVMGIIR